MNAVVHFPDGTRCLYEELDEVINEQEVSTPPPSKKQRTPKNEKKKKTTAEIRECAVIKRIKGHRATSSSPTPTQNENKKRQLLK